jgi:hypothetical protein
VIRHTNTKLNIIVQQQQFILHKQQQQQQQQQSQNSTDIHNHTATNSKKRQRTTVNIDDDRDHDCYSSINDDKHIDPSSTTIDHKTTITTTTIKSKSISNLLVNDDHDNNDNDDNDENMEITVSLGDTEIESHNKKTVNSNTAAAATTTTTSTSTPIITLQSLKRQLRIDLSTAGPPLSYPSIIQQLYQNNDTNELSIIPTIAYDCYLPNSTFSSSMPGIPDFYVTITSMDHSYPSSFISDGDDNKTNNDNHSKCHTTTKTLSFQHIQYLLQQQCQIEIPINAKQVTTSQNEPIPLSSAHVKIPNNMKKNIKKNYINHTNHDISMIDGTVINHTQSIPSDALNMNINTIHGDAISMDADNVATMIQSTPTKEGVEQQQVDEEQPLNHNDLKNNKTYTHQIPLKVATVSDSGTVIMFGIYNHGVPPNTKIDR